MIISEIHVKNFRSILDARIGCDSLTALVGRNGAGKSSFLHALELFYDPTARVVPEDFYAQDTSQDIEIAVTFSDLAVDEKSLFAPYLDAGTLTVERVFSLAQGRRPSTYHGMRLQNREFADVRGAEGRRLQTEKYNELRTTDKYSSLPSVRAADDALTALQEWENSHPESLVRMRDDGQFFGFAQVGQGYLGRHTRFIRIPAVRDASSDATDRKGSSITELMDLVVRSVLVERTNVAEFKAQMQERYEELFDPRQIVELQGLEGQLSTTLKQFAPDAAVSLRWAPLGAIDIPLPQAQLGLSEDGYVSAVDRTGHGLQRAFILTMLQHLTLARGAERAAETDDTVESGEAEDLRLPSLVLAIEEPELYLHPSRQRHLASVLLQLAHGSIPGVAKRTQVLYSTHSPLFVGLDRFDQVRLLRKMETEPDKPKTTNVATANLEEVAQALWTAKGSQGPPFTSETLRPRLQAIMTPWVNEGFFADVVVLVEGEEDRAAILGMAQTLGHNLDGQGVSVIPCAGKTNLDRPLLIFRHLGIPTYLVWDGDHGGHDQKPEANRLLLRLLDAHEEDWPSVVTGKYACFKTKIGDVLSDELGEETFTSELTKAQDEFAISRKDGAMKNPVVLGRVLTRAATLGCRSSTLEQIVNNIVALDDSQPVPA